MRNKTAITGKELQQKKHYYFLEVILGNNPHFLNRPNFFDAYTHYTSRCEQWRM